MNKGRGSNKGESCFPRQQGGLCAQLTPWMPCGPSSPQHGCCIHIHYHTWGQKTSAVRADPFLAPLLPFFLLLCPIPQLNSHLPSRGKEAAIVISGKKQSHSTVRLEACVSTCITSSKPTGPQVCGLSVPTPTSPGLHLPGNQLDKMVVQCNASTRIKGGGMAVTIEVTGDNLKHKKL